MPKYNSLENVSLTSEFTKQAMRWVNDKKNPHLGSFGARTVGLIATPFTCLIDSIVHAALFAVKASVGFFVSFYNQAIVKHINPKLMAPRDLEIASAFVHLSRLIDSLYRVALMPVLMLLDPKSGHHVALSYQGDEVKSRMNKLKGKLESLEKANLETVDSYERVREQNEKTLEQRAQTILQLKEDSSQQREIQEKLQEEIAKAKNKIEELNEKIKLAEEESDHVSLVNERNVKEFEKEISDLKEAMINYEKLQEEIAKAKNEIEELNEKINVVEKESALNKLIKKNNEKKFNNEISNLKKEMINQKNQDKKQLEETAQKTQSLEKQIDEVKTAKEKIQKNLNDEKRALEETKQKLEQEIVVLKEQANIDKEEAKKTLNEEKEKFENQLKTLAEEKKTLEETKQKLEQEIVVLKEQANIDKEEAKKTLNK